MTKQIRVWCESSCYASLSSLFKVERGERFGTEDKGVDKIVSRKKNHGKIQIDGI